MTVIFRFLFLYEENGFLKRTRELRSNAAVCLRCRMKQIHGENTDSHID
jgi:hypothetical protein